MKQDLIYVLLGLALAMGITYLLLSALPVAKAAFLTGFEAWGHQMYLSLHH